MLINYRKKYSDKEFSRKVGNQLKTNYKSREDILINTVSTILALVILFFTVYPIYYVVVNSLNEGLDAAQKSIYFWPRKFTLENYKIVFQDSTIYWSFLITILRTVVGTVASVVCLAMAAYALTKRNLVFRKFYMVFGIITLYFSASAVQSYLLYKELHLLDNFLVYILPNIYQFYYIILFIAFFNSLPQSLSESAKMDGAGEIKTLFKVILPISKPVIATICLFLGVWHWNDWFHPAFFVNSEKLMTLPAVLMRSMSLAEAQQTLQKFTSIGAGQQSVTMESVRYAMLIVAVIPVTIIYPFIQKYFIAGMTLGAVKE